ncbi:MAG: hypothetical protein LC660_03045 [Desulfobacteraceae bacterium]|nr:hypothetical protein [Desulfobacteraceae bacterium]
MIYRNHAGDKPIVHATATIHPSAVVIGNVQIGEKVFVGPNAVIRADEPCPEGKVEAIVIGSEVNIQDGVIIHALGGSPVLVGNGVTDPVILVTTVLSVLKALFSRPASVKG